MKIISFSIALILSAILLNTGCKGKGGSGNSSDAVDTLASADTGFTGIKQYMSGSFLAMETTFKNGVKDGISKTYYKNGNLKGTMWYENGLREDSAKWFYENGPLFRSTPYKRDTVDGIQRQYFRNGRLKANIGFSKGFRTPLLEEFTTDGKIIGGYPEVVVNTKDQYSTKGLYLISLSLSDKSKKVRFWRGDFGSGVFDTTKCIRIKTVEGTGVLELKKSGTTNNNSIGIIAEILTGYGNNHLVHKEIEIPYKDLN